MSVFFPEGVLNDLRSIVDGAIPSLVMVQRTGETLSARINASRQSVHIHTTPMWLKAREWLFQFDYAADVEDGDILIWHAQDYVALLVDAPVTNQISVVAHCARRTYSDTSTLPVKPNASVTFYSPDTRKTVDADVYIYAAARDAQHFGEALSYPWAVMFDPALAYSDSILVSQDHEIRWEGLGKLSSGRARGSTISKPRREPSQLPVAVSYFKEPAG